MKVVFDNRIADNTYQLLENTIGDDKWHSSIESETLCLQTIHDLVVHLVIKHSNFLLILNIEHNTKDNAISKELIGERLQVSVGLIHFELQVEGKRIHRLYILKVEALEILQIFLIRLLS